MDVDARRALEIIRRGNSESIREAINSLLGLNLQERMQTLRDEYASCGDEYCRRHRLPGYGSNVCRTCDVIDEQQETIQEILTKLDNLQHE